MALPVESNFRGFGYNTRVIGAHRVYEPLNAPDDVRTSVLADDSERVEPGRAVFYDASADAPTDGAPRFVVRASDEDQLPANFAGVLIADYQLQRRGQIPGDTVVNDTREYTWGSETLVPRAVKGAWYVRYDAGEDSPEPNDTVYVDLDTGIFTIDDDEDEIPALVFLGEKVEGIDGRTYAPVKFTTELL
jgi:hypothetical protein